MRLLSLAAAAAIISACIAAPGNTEPTSIDPMPNPMPNPMAEKVATSCVGCHDMAIISASHFDADKWAEVIDQMVSKGAQVSDAEYDPLVAYLTATYGPAAPSQ